MEKATIIILVGFAMVLILLTWRSIYLRKSEKKSKKLIEDFITLISIRFSEIEFSSDDTRKREDIALSITTILHDQTSEAFNQMLLNIKTMPQVDFRFIDIDKSKSQFVITATNKFTAKVSPSVKEVCGLILYFKGKDRLDTLQAYGDHFYHKIEKIIIKDFCMFHPRKKVKTQY
ncbi:MAG: hypothetical protein WCG25_07400 [bacterium]